MTKTSNQVKSFIIYVLVTFGGSNECLLSIQEVFKLRDFVQRSALQRNVDILKNKTLSFKLSRESKQNANKVGNAKQFFLWSGLLNS